VNKQILRLAIPFIISNITVPLVSSVDMALMGHLGSTAHLGAIGLGSAIFNFLYWNFAFIRMSVVGMTAQEYGAKNNAEIGRLLGRALLIALIGAALLLLFSNQISKLAFHIMKAKPNVEQSAINYFNIRIYAAPATLGLYALTGWFIGMQNAKAPMFIAILVNVLNVGFNFLFVAGMGMKSEGVAWGTVIAQYAGFLLALLIIIANYKKYLQHITYSALFHLKNYGKFFKINIDIFIRTLAIISVLTWYNFASADKGEIILGVNVIFLQLVYAFSFFIDGFANAAEALVGKYVGQVNIPKLKKLITYLFAWGLSLAIIFMLLYSFAWKWILSLYTSDNLVINEAKEYIVWIIVLPIVSIATFVWDGVFLGATATAEQRNATLVSALLFFIIYKLLDNVLGNHALLLAQLVFFGARGLLQTIYYKPAIINKLLNIKKNDYNL
jgi:MATE family multidrug resistance protein